MNESAKIELLIEATQKGFDSVIKKFNELYSTMQKVSNASSISSFTKLDQGLKSLDGNVKTLNTNIKTFNFNLSQMEQGFRRSEQAANSMLSRLTMQWNMKSMIHDVEQMIAVQLRWYAAQPVATAMQAALYTPAKMVGAGFEYAKELDKYTSMINRYAAMEGEASETSRKATEDIVNQARFLATQLPLEFKEIATSADRLMAAGLAIDTVKESLKSFVQLQVAFPEIEMDKFTTAMVGFLNAYRDMPGFAEMANDADRLTVILDKVAMLLAKSVLAPKDVTAVIQYLGQIGSVSGFSIDQLMAMSALITNLGSKANVSARALRGFLQSLPSETASRGFEKLGISLDRSKTIAAQFSDIISQLQTKLGTGALPAGSLKALTEIMSTERMTPLLAMINHWEDFNKLLEASQNSTGAVSRASKEMSEQLENQIKILKNLWKEISDNVVQGGYLKDAITALIVVSKAFGVVLVEVLANAVWPFLNVIKSGVNLFLIFTDAIYTTVRMLEMLNRGDFKGIGREWDQFKTRVIETNKELEKARKDQKTFAETSIKILLGQSPVTPGAKSSQPGKLGVAAPPPGETEGTKGLGALTSAIRALAKLDLQIQQEANLKALHMLENDLRNRLLVEEEYYDRKEAMIKEGGGLERRVIEEDWLETKASFDRQIAAEMDKGKKSAIIKQKELAEKKKNFEITKSIDKQEMSLDDLKVVRNEFNRRRELAIAEFVASEEKKLLAENRAQTEFNINEQSKENEFLYEKGLNTVKNYYETIKRLSRETTDAEIRDINKRFDVDLEKLNAELVGIAKGSQEWDKIQDKIASLWSQRDLDIANAQRRGQAAESTNLQNMLKTPEGIFDYYTERGGYWDGFLAVAEDALARLRKDWADTGKNIKEAWEGTTKEMASSFETFFNDVMEGNVKTMSEYFGNFVKSVMKMLNQIAAKEIAIMAMSGVKAGVAGIIGMLVGHEGGMIQTYHGGGAVVPVYHGGGLNSDEREVIVQTRERILSRQQTVMLDSMYNRVMGASYNNKVPNVEVNVINQSSQKVTAEHKSTDLSVEKTIVSVVLKDMNTNGPIYRTIKGSK
jgi:TP901 family phage tail tape measure protein